MGIVVVAALAASAALVPNGRDHGDLTANKVCRHFAQQIILAARPAVLDREVPSLDIASVSQTPRKGQKEGVIVPRRCAAE